MLSGSNDCRGSKTSEGISVLLLNSIIWVWYIEADGKAELTYLNKLDPSHIVTVASSHDPDIE